MPLTYQVVSSNPMRSVALYDWLVKEHPEVKRVALIDGDDATGRGNVEAAERNIKERGLTLAHKEFYPVDMKDFEPLVTRLLRERPDVIDIAAGAARTAMFLAVPKALSNQGFKGFLIATSVDETVMRQYAAVMEGLTVPMMIDPRAPVVTAGERDIAERYINKYSLAEFQGSTMVLYTAPLVLAQALEKAGTVDDTAKIAQVMSTAQFDLPYGKSRFAGTKTWGRPALMEQPIYMSGIRNGKAGTFASQWGTIP